MKPIQKDEVYNQVANFLKSRGLELKDGAYPETLKKGCEIFAEGVNLGQEGLEKAKVTLSKTIDEVRQSIHEKTAPKSARKTTVTADPPPTQSRPKTKAKAERKTTPKPTAKATKKKRK